MSTTTPLLGAGDGALTLDDLRGSASRRNKEAFVRLVLLGAALTSVVISGLIVISLFSEAWTFISQVEFSSLWTIGWFPRRGDYDLRTILVGSFLVTVIAMAVAAPLGLAAAIYLSEYANARTRRILKPILEVLAGIPSVVLGFFALTWISPNLVQQIFTGAPNFNLLAAGIGVGVLTVPLVASITEDSLRSVPLALREASDGLGARKATTVLRVVVPAAVSGIVAAMIVGVSRALGETMVVAIAAGGSGGSLFNWDVTQPGQTMTAAMAAVATGTDQVKGAELTFQSLFFVGALLFVLTLSLNVIADRFVTKVRQKY